MKELCWTGDEEGSTLEGKAHLITNRPNKSHSEIEHLPFHVGPSNYNDSVFGVFAQITRPSVQDVFDKIDVERKGTLTKAGIAKAIHIVRAVFVFASCAVLEHQAAAELGFPLSQAELQKAVNEMDTDRPHAR